MLSFSGSLKVFVALEPCDMRKGFNGLHALVTERLGEDPRAGALFVFSNRRHTRIKILCWDGTGLWVLTKRLEQGTFSWPKNIEPSVTTLKLTPQALALLTDGVDLRGAKLRPWYEREELKTFLQKFSQSLNTVFAAESEFATDDAARSRTHRATGDMPGGTRGVTAGECVAASED